MDPNWDSGYVWGTGSSHLCFWPCGPPDIFALITLDWSLVRDCLAGWRNREFWEQAQGHALLSFARSRRFQEYKGVLQSETNRALSMTDFVWVCKHALGAQMTRYCPMCICVERIPSHFCMELSILSALWGLTALGRWGQHPHLDMVCPQQVGVCP